MARLNTKQIIAVSLETAMQNAGIAVLVLQVMSNRYHILSDPLVCDGDIESIFSPSLTWSPHMETWPCSL